MTGKPSGSLRTPGDRASCHGNVPAGGDCLWHEVMPGNEGNFIFTLLLSALVPVTFAGLLVARVWRARRDAELSEVFGGWRFRSQLDLDPGPPYSQFDVLHLTTLSDVMEGQGDGFDVSYFDWREFRSSGTGRLRACALVQLPVPVSELRLLPDDAQPSRVGPRAAECLRTRGDVAIDTVPHALLVRSKGAPAIAVHRTALALAKAMVEDARDPGGR